eukprot:365658-Chlamydomonas_euryale.AAC.10
MACPPPRPFCMHPAQLLDGGCMRYMHCANTHKRPVPLPRSCLTHQLVPLVVDFARHDAAHDAAAAAAGAAAAAAAAAAASRGCACRRHNRRRRRHWHTARARVCPHGHVTRHCGRAAGRGARRQRRLHGGTGEGSGRTGAKSSAEGWVCPSSACRRGEPQMARTCLPRACHADGVGGSHPTPA